MAECKIKFTASDNELAFRLYQELSKTGVSCEELDVGYGVLNHTGKECATPSEKSCMRGIGDGVIEAADVFEYALNNYEKYQKSIESILGQQLSWSLDDLDRTNKFDQRIKWEIVSAISTLREILKKKNIMEGTETYKEKMALGLFYLTAIPIYGGHFGELDKHGLSEYKKYVLTNDRFRLSGDYDPDEYSAFEALTKRKGKCTEISNILFSIMKMAGLSPKFVLIPEIDSQRFEKDKFISSTPGSAHMCIGLNIDGRLRIFDPSNGISDARYNDYFPLTLRQYLSGIYSNRISWFDEKGQFDNAFAAFSTAVSIDSDNSYAYNNRGVIWAKKKQFDKARADHSEAIRRDPHSAFAYYNLGRVWEAKGLIDNAIEDYTKAIGAYPNHATAYFRRGYLRLKKGHVDKAIADNTKAINIGLPYPYVSDAYYNCGLARKKKGQLDKAIEDLTEAIWKNPRFVNAYYLRASVWRKIARFDKAIEDYTEIIKINPKDADAYYNCGISWFFKGNKTNAEKDIKMAAQLDRKYKTSAQFFK